MENKPLVSIIVPVYNAQKYLIRCIESLLNQTYSNLEIILINDGSNDNSGAICADFAKRDNRILVINQCNKGAAEAKNTGLNSYTGEYVTFIDSDDFVKETYIEKLYELSIKYQADIVQCMYHIGTKGYFETNDGNSTTKVFDGNNIFKSTYYKSIVWGKLYKGELFSGIRFIPNRIIDDEGVSYKSYYQANKTVITTEQLYYYYQSSNSIMRNNKKIDLDFMDTFEERLTFFKNRNETELFELSLEKYCIVLMLNYMTVFNNSLNNDNDTKKIMDRFDEIFTILNKGKYRNLRSIIILQIFKFFPGVSSKIRKIVQRR